MTCRPQDRQVNKRVTGKVHKEFLSCGTDQPLTDMATDFEKVTACKNVTTTHHVHLGKRGTLFPNNTYALTQCTPLCYRALSATPDQVLRLRVATVNGGLSVHLLRDLSTEACCCSWRLVGIMTVWIAE